MKKAYSYIRFSTLEQAKGNSLERQLKLREEYVKKHGLVLDTSLSMKDLGLSAFKKKNITAGALGEFLKAVENGLIEKGSYLLVESLDRISRAEVTEQITIFLNLIRSGIIIVTLIDGIIYTEETINKQMNELLYSVMIMSRGYEESLTKSKRLKDSWNSKRGKIEKEKITSIRPAWLDFDKESGAFIRNEEKCKIVSLIFEMADQGIGKDRIAKNLNKSETPTFGRSTFWHQSYIQKILQNKSVIGEFQPHLMKEGKRVPINLPQKDYFPRVISDELFFRANNKRKALSKLVGKARSSNRNLFSGLLRCGYSNSTMVLSNKGRWHYLVASNAKVGKKGIKYISWSYRDFETSFFSFVKDLNVTDIVNPDFPKKTAELKIIVSKLENEIEELKKGLSNLVSFIMEGNSSKTISETITNIENEIEMKSTKLNEYNNNIVTFERIETESQFSQEQTVKLLDHLEEPQVRDKLKIIIRQQIDQIDVFAGGPLKKKYRERNLSTIFLDFPDLTELKLIDFENDRKKYADFVADRLNEGLKLDNDEDEEDAVEDIPLEKKLLSTNKKQFRYFVVHFKTGVIRYVMPCSDNPNKIKKAFTQEMSKIKSEGFIIELG